MMFFLRYIHLILIGGCSVIPLLTLAQLSLISSNTQSILSPTQAFHITWKSEAYIPPSYRGKALATTRAPITIAFEITDGDRLVDVSRKEIRWFINNTFIQKGIGLQHIRYIPDNRIDDDFIFRIDIIDFNGEVLHYSYTIPTTHPRLVIDAPYTLDSLSVGTYSFVAIPFYFNISRLSDITFIWDVQGQTTEGSVKNPHILELQVAPSVASHFVLNTRAFNIHNRLESTSLRMELFVP